MQPHKIQMWLYYRSKILNTAQHHLRSLLQTLQQAHDLINRNHSSQKGTLFKREVNISPSYLFTLLSRSWMAWSWLWDRPLSLTVSFSISTASRSSSTGSPIVSIRGSPPPLLWSASKVGAGDISLWRGCYIDGQREGKKRHLVKLNAKMRQVIKICLNSYLRFLMISVINPHN